MRHSIAVGQAVSLPAGCQPADFPDLDQHWLCRIRPVHRKLDFALSLYNGTGELFGPFGIPTTDAVFTEATSDTSTPEPSSFLLLAFGGLGLGFHFRPRVTATTSL